jgi:hypothetical protein
MSLEMNYLPPCPIGNPMPSVTEYEFAGCKFLDHSEGANSIFDPMVMQGTRHAFLTFHAELMNPEKEGEVHAFKGYNPDFHRFGDGRKYAAAWLISHWYEHALKLCRCQLGYGESHHFTHAFISTLLFLETYLDE